MLLSTARGNHTANCIDAATKKWFPAWAVSCQGKLVFFPLISSHVHFPFQQLQVFLKPHTKFLAADDDMVCYFIIELKGLELPPLPVGSLSPPHPPFQTKVKGTGTHTGYEVKTISALKDLTFQRQLDLRAWCYDRSMEEWKYVKVENIQNKKRLRLAGRPREEIHNRGFWAVIHYLPLHISPLNGTTILFFLHYKMW